MTPPFFSFIHLPHCSDVERREKEKKDRRGRGGAGRGYIGKKEVAINFPPSLKPADHIA